EPDFEQATALRTIAVLQTPEISTNSRLAPESTSFLQPSSSQPMSSLMVPMNLLPTSPMRRQRTLPGYAVDDDDDGGILVVTVDREECHPEITLSLTTDPGDPGLNDVVIAVPDSAENCNIPSESDVVGFPPATGAKIKRPSTLAIIENHS
ncbi:unnamed protein product, partial [Notodromas monacha]